MPFDPTKPFEVVGTEPTGFDPSKPFTVVAEPPAARASAPAFDPSQPFEVVESPAFPPVTTPARDLVTNPPQIQPSPRPAPTFSELDPAVALIIEHGKAARSSLLQTGRGASAALEGLAAGAQSTAEALGLEAKDSARFGIVDALKAGAADSRAFYEEKLADPALQQDPSIRNATYAERPFAKAGLAATSQALPFAAGLAASAASGSPAPMMALYATTGYGDTYANAKQAGASETAAQTTAMVNAAWQGLSERFGIGGLLEAPKRTILANIAAGATRESIQEAIQTIGSNIIERIGYAAGRQWTEGLADAIAGAFVLGAGGGATIRQGQPPAAPPFDPSQPFEVVSTAQPAPAPDPEAAAAPATAPLVPVTPVDRSAGLFQPPPLDGAQPIVLPEQTPVGPIDRTSGLFQPASIAGAPPIVLPQAQPVAPVAPPAPAAAPVAPPTPAVVPEAAAPQPAPVSNDTPAIPFDPSKPFTVVEQPPLIDQPRTQKNLSTERAQINRILDELDKAEADGRGRPYVYDDLVKRLQHIDTMLYDQAMGRGASAYEFPRTSSRREAEAFDQGERPAVDAIGWMSGLTIPENAGFAELQELSRQIDDALEAQPYNRQGSLEEGNARDKVLALSGKIERQLVEHPDNPDNREVQSLAQPAVPVAGTQPAQVVRSPEAPAAAVTKNFAFVRSTPRVGTPERNQIEFELTGFRQKQEAIQAKYADALATWKAQPNVKTAKAKDAGRRMEAAREERRVLEQGNKGYDLLRRAEFEDKIEASNSRIYQLSMMLRDPYRTTPTTAEEYAAANQEAEQIIRQQPDAQGLGEDVIKPAAQEAMAFTAFRPEWTDEQNLKSIIRGVSREKRNTEAGKLESKLEGYGTIRDANKVWQHHMEAALHNYVEDGEYRMGTIVAPYKDLRHIEQIINEEYDRAKKEQEKNDEKDAKESFARRQESAAFIAERVAKELPAADVKTPQGRAARIWETLRTFRKLNLNYGGGFDRKSLLVHTAGRAAPSAQEENKAYAEVVGEAAQHLPSKKLAKDAQIPQDEMPRSFKLPKYSEKVKPAGPTEAVRSAASTDDSRFVLNSVYVDGAHGAIVSTDGRRMHIAQDPTAKGEKIMQIEKGKMVGEMKDHRYPNYTQVIPTTAQAVADVDSADLLEQAGAVEQLYDKVIDSEDKVIDSEDKVYGKQYDVYLNVGGKRLVVNASWLADVARFMQARGVSKLKMLIPEGDGAIVFTGKNKGQRSVAVLMTKKQFVDDTVEARTEGWDNLHFKKVTADPAAANSELAAMRKDFKIAEPAPVADESAAAPVKPDGDTAGPADAPINSIPRAYDPDPPVLNGVRVDTNAPVGTGDIVRFIAKAFDVPLRVGGFRRAAEGFYRSFSENIRLKRANEIPVAFHELGHYLHNVVFPGNPDQDARGSRTDEYSTFGKRFDTELMPLGALTSRPSYSKHQVRMEGVAEFLRVYMGNRADALTQAPNFTAHFEAETAKQPELRAAIDKARAMVTKWRQQPAGARIDAHIRTSEDGRRTYTPRQIVGNLYTKWVDQTAPITRTLENMVEAGASPGLARAIQARIVNFIGGWRGKVEHALNNRATNLRGQEVGEGLRAILRDAAKAAPPSLLAPGQQPLELFRRYMVAKHAKEDLFPRGIETGLQRSDVEHEVATLGPVFEPHFRRLLAFQRIQRDLLVESGVISRETARAMDAKHQWYVPFHRFHEGVAGRSRGGAGTGFINTPTGIRRMKGSTREILDPIETIIKNAYVFRELAERNRIGEAFARFLDDTRGGGRIGDQVSKKMAPTKVTTDEIVQMLNDAGVDPDLVEQVADAGPSGNIWRAIDSVKPRDGIFKVYRNGKEVHYQIDDGELYRAMTLADTTDAEILARFPFLRSFNWFTRLKRAGATLTPEFILRNPIRDQFAAAIYSKDGTYIPFVDMFRGMFHVLRKDGVYQRWVREGGRYAHMVGADKTNLQESLEEVMREPGAAGFISEMMNPLHPIRTLQNISTLMEESTRVGIFGKALGSGASPIAAANLSKDGTLNFSRHGTHGKLVNMLSAFFNAGVQDLDKLVRAHTDRSTAPGVAMRGFLYITIPSLLTWFLGKDDEEIQNLPGWRKNLAWNFRIPGLEGIWSLPKPFLLGSIYGTSVERALDVIYKDDPGAARQWFDSVLGQMPGGGPGPKESLFIPPGMIPDVIKTAIEGMANYSFFRNAPIVPQRLLDLPKAEQYTETTSRAGRAVGQVAGISPMLVDNAIRNTFAGLGKVGLDILDATIIKLSGEELPPSPARPAVETTPGLRAFKVPEGEASRKIEEFYLGIHNAEALWKAAAAKDPERDIKWYRANQVGLLYYHERLPDLRRLSEYMADLNTARRAVVAARDMTPAQKQAALVKLSQERERVAKAGVSLMLPADITRRR